MRAPLARVRRRPAARPAGGDETRRTARTAGGAQLTQPQVQPRTGATGGGRAGGQLTATHGEYSRERALLEEGERAASSQLHTVSTAANGRYWRRASGRPAHSYTR